MSSLLKDLIAGAPQAARTLKSLIGNEVKPIYDDYSQLWGKGSNLRNDATLLRGKIDKLVPPQSAFSSPQQMQEWSLKAALNAPMGLSTKLPKTKFSEAHDIAQRNAALPIEQGGLGLPPNNTAMDRARALGFDTDAYHGRTGGTYIPEENQALAKEFRDKAREIEDKLVSKYGFIGNRVNYDAWETDSLYKKLIDAKDKYRSLESEHYTNNPEIKNDSFDPLLSGDLGTHFSASPIVSSEFAKNGVVYPVLLNGKMNRIDDSFSVPFSAQKLIDDLDSHEMIPNKDVNLLRDKAYELDRIKLKNDRDWGENKRVTKFTSNVNKTLVKNKADNLVYRNAVEGGGDSYSILDPKNIRSRFAAFDPMKKDSANILASMLGGTTLASQYQKDKKKKK